MNEAATVEQIASLIERAKIVAIEYYQLTGKPLGVTGEIGEFEAARLLGLKLAIARESGYDAVDREGRRLQIKARSIPENKKLTGQRLGRIDLNKPWDAVLLVLMDNCFSVKAIYEAGRIAIATALQEPGSKARNERGALAIAKFKSIGKEIWKSEAKV